MPACCTPPHLGADPAASKICLTRPAAATERIKSFPGKRACLLPPASVLEQHKTKRNIRTSSVRQDGPSVCVTLTPMPALRYKVHIQRSLKGYTYPEGIRVCHILLENLPPTLSCIALFSEYAHVGFPACARMKIRTLQVL